MPKILGNSLAEHRTRTRDALFTALGQLLAQRTFERITLSDVAAQAGVGRTAVYNHFADKEDLLLAFMEHETRRYAAALEAALVDVDDPVDQLRVYVREQALLTRHYHFSSGGRLAESVSRGTAGHLRSHAGLMEQLLATILTTAIDAGLVPDQDVRATVGLVHATVLGSQPTPRDPEARETHLRALDTFILRAVGAPTADHPVPAVVRHEDHEPRRSDHAEDDARVPGDEQDLTRPGGLRCPVAG